MRVAIVGGGVAGLVNARVLLPLGVEVVVYESRSDVGGAWSGTRGYPGQRLQNDKRTYAFSDFPMPEGYPENPNRAEVQAYLAAYAELHGLGPAIRLSTTVVHADYDAEVGHWRITTAGPEGAGEDRADWLIVANGTLCTPNRPILPGIEAFERAGGRVVDAADLGDHADFAGQRIAILGYGKSATDIAVAAVGRAATIDVLARSAPWKLPYRFGSRTFQDLVISRVGEHLIWAPYRTVGGRIGKRVDTGVRFLWRTALARYLRRSQRLDERGLVPFGTIRELSHLVTPGFSTAVDAGQVALRTGVRITRLAAGAEGPEVRLDDGSTVPADLLVAATGYRTDVAFLDERTRALLVDGQGRMPMLRHTVPERAPRLLFAGWTGSFRSVIASELQAVWIAAMLHGAVELPQGPWAGRVRQPAAPTGLAIVDQDAWLHDAGLAMPRSVIRRELFRPLDPSAYAGIHERLRHRLRDRAPLVDAHLRIQERPAAADRVDLLRHALRLPPKLYRAATGHGRPSDAA